MTYKLSVMNAVRDVFGASHLGVEETRLSDIAYLYQETNDMRFLSIMLCMTGTLVERPFRGLFERAVVHVLPSHFYWREESHQLDWASCMTVVLRVPPVAWDSPPRTLEWSESSSPSTRACRRDAVRELVLLNDRRPASARALSAVKMPAQTFGGVDAHAAIRNKLGLRIAMFSP